MASPEAWIRASIEAALPGVSVYPVNVPESAPPPYVCYARTGTRREVQFDGVVGLPEGTFEVQIFVDGYSDAKAAADAIRQALHNFSGSANGSTIDYAYLTNEQDGDPTFLEGRDVPTYLISHEYAIRWQE